MQVPLLDLKLQYAPLKAAIEAAIVEVCDSQYFVLGPHVAALESRIAEYSGVAHGIGTSSGTDALLLALMALDIGPGDEVITTPFTFFATAGVIARLGARPAFCDIDPGTFNLSPDAVARFLEAGCEQTAAGCVNIKTGNRVRVMMPVHLYGQLADMRRLVEIATRYGLQIVEDAAQAIGAEAPDGGRAGSFGDVGCFSFFPTKNLGAFGDAGMCVTNDAALAGKLGILRVHGGEQKYYHSMVGGNFRLDALQAVVLNIKLDHLDGWTEGRQRNAAHYSRLIAAAGLEEFIKAPDPGEGRHIFNQYVVRCERRDELRAHLADSGIGTEIYYPLSLHQQDCFAGLGYAHTDFPEARKACAETLALPIFAELTVAQREYVIARVESFYRA